MIVIVIVIDRISLVRDVQCGNALESMRRVLRRGRTGKKRLENISI